MRHLSSCALGTVYVLSTDCSWHFFAFDPFNQSLDNTSRMKLRSKQPQRQPRRSLWQQRFSFSAKLSLEIRSFSIFGLLDRAGVIIFRGLSRRVTRMRVASSSSPPLPSDPPRTQAVARNLLAQLGTVENICQDGLGAQEIAARSQRSQRQHQRGVVSASSHPQHVAVCQPMPVDIHLWQSCQA